MLVKMPRLRSKANAKSTTLTQGQFIAAQEYARDGSLFPDSKYHGDDHWRAVAAQGILLANTLDLGPDARTVALLFGLFHDCRRINDDWDPEHGIRGAQAMLDCKHIHHLNSRLFDILTESIAHHDGGMTTKNPLIGLGWDADRSTLLRVGIAPAFGFFSCASGGIFENYLENGVAMSNSPPTWESLFQATLAT